MAIVTIQALKCDRCAKTVEVGEEQAPTSRTLPSIFVRLGRRELSLGDLCPKCEEVLGKLVDKMTHSQMADGATFEDFPPVNGTVEQASA